MQIIGPSIISVDRTNLRIKDAYIWPDNLLLGAIKENTLREAVVSTPAEEDPDLTEEDLKTIAKEQMDSAEDQVVFIF